MWIYLGCSTDLTSSAESEESVLPLAIGSNLSHTAKLTHTVKEFCSPEWLMGGLIPHQSGLISKHLWPRTLQAAVISSQADFPARISVLQGLEKAWEESEVAYFSRSCAWPKKSSPSSYSLKMCQLSLLEEEAPWLKRLPKWGMIVGGVLYPLRALEHYTVVKGGSYWATPNTMDGMELRSEEALKHQFTHARKGRTKPANLREQVHPQCWPQNLFPTPQARSAPDCPAERMRHTPSLESVANMEQSTNGKKLCPAFVELLMGYPKEWTVLEDWAMQWFQSKRKKRSKS